MNDGTPIEHYHLVRDAQDRRLQIVNGRTCPVQKNASNAGQLDFTCCAVEKPCANDGLQFFDASTQCGWGQMDVVSGRSKAAPFGHGDESLKLLQIEIDVSHASMILKIAIQ